MLKFPKEIGRTYLNLHEVSERLGITKDKVLHRLAKEALVYLRCEAIPQSKFNNNDYDIDSIKWIEGLFWLPVEAYVDLVYLLENSSGSVYFPELSPQSMINLTDNIPFLDGTQRCHAACEDWLYVEYPDVAGCFLNSFDDIYFWEETVQEFAKKNGLIPRIIPPHFLPLDVTAKSSLEPNNTSNHQQLITENQALKAKVAELEKKLQNRVDVRETTTLHNLVVALLDCCLTGDDRTNEAPKPFANESALLSFIDKRYEGYYGITQSNLTKKLPKIKKYVKEHMIR